jgi:hypothetical protein
VATLEGPGAALTEFRQIQEALRVFVREGSEKEAGIALMLLAQISTTETKILMMMEKPHGI